VHSVYAKTRGTWLGACDFATGESPVGLRALGGLTFGFAPNFRLFMCCKNTCTKLKLLFIVVMFNVLVTATAPIFI